MKAMKKNKINRPVDGHGNTALHYAVIRNNHVEVERLLKQGANPLLPNKHGRTPLDIAHKPGRMAGYLPQRIELLIPLLSLYAEAHRSGIKAEKILKMRHPWLGKKYYRSAPLSDVILEGIF